MSTKEEYCFRVMRKYGVLVNVDGEASKVNVPGPLLTDETVASWCNRVLGADAGSVVMYVPERINGRRNLSTLQRLVDSDHLRKVVRAQGKVKDAQAEIKTEKAVEKTEQLFSTFSKDTIQDHLAELGDTLEESVKDFFQRQIENSPDDIDAEILFKELIKRFNDVVCSHRKLVARP